MPAGHRGQGCGPAAARGGPGPPAPSACARLRLPPAAPATTRTMAHTATLPHQHGGHHTPRHVSAQAEPRRHRVHWPVAALCVRAYVGLLEPPPTAASPRPWLPGPAPAVPPTPSAGGSTRPPTRSSALCCCCRSRGRERRRARGARACGSRLARTLPLLLVQAMRHTFAPVFRCSPCGPAQAVDTYGHAGGSVCIKRTRRGTLSGRRAAAAAVASPVGRASGVAPFLHVCGIDIYLCTRAAGRKAPACAVPVRGARPSLSADACTPGSYPQKRPIRRRCSATAFTNRCHRARLSQRAGLLTSLSLAPSERGPSLYTAAQVRETLLRSPACSALRPTPPAAACPAAAALPPAGSPPRPDTRHCPSPALLLAATLSRWASSRTRTGFAWCSWQVRTWAGSRGGANAQSVYCVPPVHFEGCL